MELTHDEVERLIAKISSGKDFVYIDNLKDFLLFRHPDLETRQLADAIYERSYNRAIEEGLLPLEKLENLIAERGIYTEQDQQQVDRLRSQLEAQTVLLSKTVKVKANRDRISNKISDLKNQIAEILNKKHSRLILSAESKSEEAKNQYLCWACVFKSDGSHLWLTYEDYSLDTDLHFKSEVLSRFVDFLSGLDITTIRYLARHTLWRIRYTNSMKTSDQLFGTPSSHYSSDQLSLTYWSNFYDQVYSMMPEDRPADEVIEDDVSLDAYMSEYYKELNNEAAVRRGNKQQNTKGSMSAFDKEEVIVTRSHDLYEDIEYDKPREAQRVKDRTELRKRTSKKRV